MGKFHLMIIDDFWTYMNAYPPNKVWTDHIGVLKQFFDESFREFHEDMDHSQKVLVECLIDYRNFEKYFGQSLFIVMGENTLDEIGERVIKARPDILMHGVVEAIRLSGQLHYFDKIQKVASNHNLPYTFHDISIYTNPFWSSSPDYDLFDSD